MFNYKTQETFDKEFPAWLKLCYEELVQQKDREYVKERYGKIFKKRLDKNLVSFDTYKSFVKKNIDTEAVSWMESLAYNAYKSHYFDFYKKFINDLYYQFPLVKFYFNSPYAGFDMKYLAEQRLNEILTGIDLENIETNLIYSPSLNLSGNYKYLLVDVFIQLYDDRTKIYSDKLALLGLSMCWEEKECYVKFKNEQAIRRTTKQFIEDMA